MRTHTCGILVALAIKLTGTLTLPAQDWQTVDDFAIAGGNAEAHGVATDAAGGIYVVGAASGHGIVRYSADGGLTWITRDDFVYPSAAYYWETNNLFSAVIVDYQGSVFVGGTGGGHWLVRRSIDHGITWETVDDYYRPWNAPNQLGTNGAVYSLVTDGQGRVYGAGPMGLFFCPCYNYWWIRGSGIGGTNWDTKLVLSSGYGGISQATCAGEDVYVTGSIEGFPAIGLMLKSSDHGTTWTTNFEGIHDFHDAIRADSAGNLYSAGTSWISNSVDWLVRRAAPGGTNWTILDRSLYEGDPYAGLDYPYATSIAVDATGNLCVTGEFIDYWVVYGANGSIYGGANETWFTRQYVAATGQWSTTDNFSYSTNMHSYAMGTSIALDGSALVVGYGTSDSGQRRWVVRKRASPPPIALARALDKAVNDLIARSPTAKAPARVLLAFLGRILAQMERGDSASVCSGLRIFSKKVQELMNHGTLAQSDGELLMNGTDNLRLLLGCPKREEEKSQP